MNGAIQRKLIEVDYSRNCYSCSNLWQGIVRQERRLEYRKNTNNEQSNLNGKESLVVLN